MTKIIQFPGSYNPNNTTTTDTKGKKPVYDYNISDYTGIDEGDSFIPSSELNDEQELLVRKTAGYSLEEMAELVGEERVNEIFSNLIVDGSPAVISPVAGTKPFREGLKEIWDDSDNKRAERLAKKTDLYRTLRAFEEFEEECSDRHNEIYGTNTNVKITLTDEEGETYFLTDELKKQLDFYKKGKIGQTFSLIGQKINNGLIRFADSMTIDD